MKQLRRVSAGILLAYMLVALSTAYWSLRRDELLARSDNPRQVQATAAIQRGNIYDRRGFVLATTSPEYDGEGQRRLYPHPEAEPAVGYYSMRYGTGGVEASYDALLSGRTDAPSLQTFVSELLHLSPRGGDVRLTLDLQVQKAALEALGSYHGAAIVITTSDGAVRAMASTPSFNPNALDQNWPVLVQESDAPLLNRVTQGIYQPGGTLQTSHLAAALTRGQSTNAPVPAAERPVNINGIRLSCGMIPPLGALTLEQAYLYACPGAFASLPDTPAGAVDASFWRFGLVTRPEILGLVTSIAASPLPLAYEQEPTRIAAGMAGQGSLTVTSLQILDLVSAIANNGNIPLYTLVEATRSPGSTLWTPVNNNGLSRAVLTRQNAERMWEIMRTAALEGIAAPAQAQTDFPLSGHAATAYSGPDARPLQWFVGLIPLENGGAVAAVVVIENAPSPAIAARIGGQVLDAAAQAFNVAPTEMP